MSQAAGEPGYTKEKVPQAFGSDQMKSEAETNLDYFIYRNLFEIEISPDLFDCP